MTVEEEKPVIYPLQRRPLMQLQGVLKADNTFTDHQSIRDAVAQERGRELLEEAKTLQALHPKGF